jgi:class 3 adenylate cyclase
MMDAVHRYEGIVSEEVRRSHGVKAQIRIGINSGEVVVRAIGSDLRMDYSAWERARTSRAVWSSWPTRAPRY